MSAIVCEVAGTVVIINFKAIGLKRLAGTLPLGRDIMRLDVSNLSTWF
jgi:hypothetical protein